MIPHDVEVLVALDPVNMHLSFDRLAGLVTERMGRSARDPALYVFLNRRRTLLKALFFDGTGLCVFYKRLDRSRFRLPEPVDDGQVVEMSEEELENLLDGLEPGAPRRGGPKNRDSLKKISSSRLHSTSRSRCVNDERDGSGEHRRRRGDADRARRATSRATVRARRDVGRARRDVGRARRDVG